MSENSGGDVGRRLSRAQVTVERRDLVRMNGLQKSRVTVLIRALIDPSPVKGPEVSPNV